MKTGLDKYKLNLGCELKNGKIIETEEYKNNLLKINLKELNSQRDNELKGFIIDNIYLNSDIIKSMAVEHSVSADKDKIQWIGVDNTIVEFTKTEFGGLIKKGTLKVKEIYFKYRQLKDELLK